MTKSVLASSGSTEKLNIDHQIKLYSVTKKIEACDPLLFYVGNQPFYPNESFFWKSPDEAFILVGFGSEYTIHSDQYKQRYKQVEDEWQNVCKEAKVINPYDQYGTGPILFGGFSFDSIEEKNDEWKNFNESYFYLPTCLLTVNGNETFITINYFGDAQSLEEMDEQIDVFLARIADEIPPLSTIDNQAELDVGKWIEAVDDVVHQFKDPSLKKVVLARKMKVEFTSDQVVGAVLKQLLHQQTNSFIFALQAKQSYFLGASPERLVKKINENVYSTSLAGSIGRGKNEEDDEKLAEWLFNDKKNRFEHDVVISMIKEALQPHCSYVHAPKIPMILKTPDIQHLYTPVQGLINNHSSILQIVGGLHPTPALGGLPVHRAKNIIREKEGMNRGLYAAPIGWLDYRMNGEFVVAIRCGLIEGNQAYLYAGCGLVKGSKSADELIETRIKFQPMLRAVEGE